VIQENREVKIACKRTAALGWLCAVWLLGGGCQLPMALGTFESIGGASPTAVHHLGRGKAESFWLARFEDVVKGTESAGQTLSVRLTEKKVEDGQAFFRFSDDRGDDIAITIERRTARVTSIHLDAGYFGSIAFVNLFARQIVVELIEAGVFPDDPEPETDDGKGFKNL
jgi:Protein of unknown function (DUF3568)